MKSYLGPQQYNFACSFLRPKTTIWNSFPMRWIQQRIPMLICKERRIQNYAINMQITTKMN